MLSENLIKNGFYCFKDHFSDFWGFSSQVFLSKFLLLALKKIKLVKVYQSSNRGAIVTKKFWGDEFQFLEFYCRKNLDFRFYLTGEQDIRSNV